MKASLVQRLEYVQQQLLQARMALRLIDRHLKNDGGTLCDIFTQTDGRLEKVARVLNGSEPPLGKRNALDLESDIADPLE